MLQLKTVIQIIIITLLPYNICASAKNITKKTDEQYTITLDDDFWQYSEAVKRSPQIIINASPIEPGDVICYYEGISSSYTYKFEAFKDQEVLVLRKYNKVIKDLKGSMPLDENSEVIILKPENSYQKVFHLVIRDVEIKISPIKKTSAVKAQPVDIGPKFNLPFKIF